VAELHEYRERFPILAETTYLINHSLGAMPAAAEERLIEYARAWNTRGVRAWEEGWWDLPLVVGDQIARLIGAPPGSVSMHQNVTIAEAVVVSCFGFDGPRRRIVYEEGNFPSVRYLYQAQRGADILVAADAEGVVEAIDERTLLVPVTHVLYKTGEIQDVEAIVAKAHDTGALVVLDAYQSVGTVPLDVTALGVDFAVGGSVKWLCGGPGAAWLYVRPDLAATLEPALTGWQAHARPFAFEPEQDYADGSARFLTGTPNVPALYAATAGYDVVEEVGVERIRERSQDQTALLVELLDEAGFPAGGPHQPERRGGTVVVQVPGSKRVNRELAERGVICDWRPDVGLRLGPHFFNTDDELRFAVEQIVELSGRAAPTGAARS
jgi:kynureninase